MIIRLESLLTSEQCAEYLNRLSGERAAWRQGKETAGWHARAVKNNYQLDKGSDLYRELSLGLLGCLQSNPLFNATSFPRSIHNILFSRCGPGEGYGRHVDNAWMQEGRSDLSFTVFISDSVDYEGGSLVLESPLGEEAIKLQAGQAIVYPSTLLHRVEPITAGTRFVAVGWVESRIRHGDQRELLFELDTARRALFEKSGKDDVFDIISRSYSNLLRFWDS